MNKRGLSTEEFTDLLPWYLNGTLDAERQELVRQHAASHTDAARMLEQQRTTRAAVRRNAAEMPADLGWEGYARRHGLHDSAAAPRPATGRGGWPRALAAAALVVMAGEAAVIGVLWNDRASEPEYATVRSAAPPAVSGQVLQLRFKPQAAELDVRKLLLAVDGRIVAGPSQVGDYLVAVPEGRADEAQRTLSGSPLVQGVSVHR